MFIDLTPERAVAGGWMLARHEDRVVLVRGAIPGERVRVRVIRGRKRTVWAEVVEVVESSPDRRPPPCDPACAGSAYAHIAYERQRALKAEVIADAFRHLGAVRLEQPVAVAASPETGYRLRARLHVQGRRWGFFREGTHRLCDAATTGQLSGGTVAAIEALHGAHPELFAEAASLIISENVAATDRVVHVERHAATGCGAIGVVDGVTGVTASAPGGAVDVLAGRPAVEDTAADLFQGRPPVDGATVWRRHATSFFQANRFLVGALVARVLAAAEGDRFVDLYAGVGLFAVALAARGAAVLAVEGDPASAADLEANALPFGGRLQARRASVEEALGSEAGAAPDAVILDPPRNGASAEALDGVSACGARRLVYVSCDPPTLARDAARLRAAGYALTALDAFDLFPNTPHVEVVAMFDQRGQVMNRARAHDS